MYILYPVITAILYTFQPSFVMSPQRQGITV